MHCEAYGTVLETNFPWSSLTSAPASEQSLSIHVERVSCLPAREPLLSSCHFQGRTVQVLGTVPDLFIQIDDILLIAFCKGHRRIDCYATPQAGDNVIEYWLLRQIVPIARLLWGEAEILHAGAVRIGNEVAAFLAPSYTGKSTLVGHFVQRGYNLVTDDHLVVDRYDATHAGSTWVFPTIPYYRNYRAPESLGHYTDRYDSGAYRLRVIYVLKRADPTAPVSISALSNSEAALELLHQAPYRILNLQFPTMIPLARKRFEFIANLPLNVPIRRLEVPRSLDRLGEVEACITADFDRIPGGSNASL